MAFRNNRRNFGAGAGFGRGGMNPWDSQGQFGPGGRQGGPMNAEALSLANNLLNNLLRNQNPPSLLDLPRGGQVGRGNRQLHKKNNRSNKNSSNSMKESIYADVPNVMFYCHLCKKHMWDSTSFENHIKGRTHLMMREGIEESYRLKANMIRQEAKIAEQLKAIELDRLKRMGKSGGKQSQIREYCTMCDLNFHGHMSQHRKSDGHLALKKFLHPKCNECNKEFPTRIEYDTHLLTPEHLKKASERNTKVGERKKNNLIILTEDEETKDLRPPTKKKKKEIKKEEGEKKEGEEGVDAEKKENGGEEGAEKMEGDETKEGEELLLNETKEEEEEEEEILAEDPDDCILDFHDGDEVPIEVENRLPKYNWTRPVGVSLISKLECFECTLCCKFFDNDKTAEVHSRTFSHHRQFTKFLNEKSSDTKIAQKRAAAAIEESERKKRRIEEAEKEAEAAAENGEGSETIVKVEGEVYDPSEATGDEDAEMAVDDANNGEGVVADDANGDSQEDMEEEKEDETEKTEENASPSKDSPTKAKGIVKAAVGAAAVGAVAVGAIPAATAAVPKTPRSRGRGRYNK